jgi:hypothetical protein
MDDLRGKYRFPYRGFDMDVGSNSAVLTQTFVAESIRRDERRDDGLNAFRGAVNAVLISLVFWVALGLAIFAFF